MGISAAQGPEEGVGAVHGFVELQGSPDNGGAIVRVGGRRATTNASSEYVVSNVPAGHHTVKVSKSSYLTTSMEVEVWARETAHLPDVALRWGDLNEDGEITVFELATIGRNLRASAEWEGPVDYSEGVVAPIPQPVPVPPEELIKLNLLKELQGLKAVLRGEENLRIVDDLMIKVEAMLEVEEAELDTKRLAIQEVERLIGLLREQPGPGNGGDPPSLTVSFDGKDTFLHTDPSDSPAPPMVVDLGTAGFFPGDLLELTFDVDSPGFSYFGCNGPFEGPEGTPLIGLFSASDQFLDPSATARVPGAIDAGNDVETGPTFGGEPQDIPEDFSVQPHDGVLIEVPAGATHLFLGVADSHFGDN